MGSKTPVAPPHPHVTVDDVWRGALPPETQMVAGAAGMRREVVWCTALRARSPAFTPLRGGELLLINPQVLTAVDARLTLARLLESLAGQGVAGAAVSGRVSAEARQVADAHGLPLFALPAGIALDQVEQQVLRYVVDRRAELHERAQDLHRQLSELALAGRGLPALLARLHELTGIPVLLEHEARVDYVGAGDRLPEDVGAAIAAERPALDEWLREVPLSAFDPPVALRSLTGGRARLIAPILVQGSIAGFLSLVGSDGELGELPAMRCRALVRERGAPTVALISLAGRRAPESKSLVDQLHRTARAATGAAVALGYGAIRSGATEVAAAAREAEQALAMGRRLFGPDSATAFSDLGLYRLLYALQPLPELRDFRDQALARLRGKDRGGELLKTLAAYLATNGSPTDAADRLHLHRNTVLYRLGRIEDLLQADLRDAEVRLSLYLALKIGDVLDV